MTNYAFQSLFDFTRTTSGTFVGSNGLIQTTPASVNLLTYTQDFDNAGWGKVAATVTANNTVAPDGTSTADKAVATATTGFHDIRQFVTGTVASYVYSVYAKAAEYSKLIFANASAGTWSATFDLATGATIATGGTAVLSSSIQSVGNGWYRCAVTFTGAASSAAHTAMGYPNTGATLNNFGASYTGDGTSGIFIWGAQLQTGSTATDYTRNNGGVYPPRFDYDPATLQPKGILIEEQRTNLLTYSQEIGGTNWLPDDVTVALNSIAAPNGTLTASTLTDTATNSDHRAISSGTNPSFTVGTSYTLSVYVKNNTRNFVQLVFGTAAFSATAYANFDVATGVLGTVGSGTTASITAVGSGWYRCTITAAATVTASTPIFFGLITSATAVRAELYAGTGSSLYVWGAQLEAGAFATSYIPTVASQVTRTADQCSIVAPMFAPWYNQSEGTFVFEGSSVAPATLAQTLNALAASDGTNNNINRVGRYLNFWFGETRNGNVQQAAPQATAGSYTQNATAKVAYAYKTNDFALSANGATAVTDTSGTVPTVITRLDIGGPPVELNGHIRSVRYYPVRLADFQLQALTA